MRLHTKGFTSIRWCARNLMKLLHRESLTQRTLATEDFDVAKSQFDTSFCRLTSISCQRVTFEISKRQLILRQFLTFDPNFIGKGFGWTFKIENSTPLSDVRPSFHERATPSFTKFAFHHTFCRVRHTRSPQRLTSIVHQFLHFDPLSCERATPGHQKFAFPHVCASDLHGPCRGLRRADRIRISPHICASDTNSSRVRTPV